MNFETALFRCSSLGLLMTEPNKEKTIYYAGDAEVSAAKYNSLIDKAVASLDTDALALLRVKKVPTGETLSETTKSYLINYFVQFKYGREKEFSNRYVKKGLAVEEDSITLLFQHTGQYFEKNVVRLNNEWISGLPDLYDGKSIHEAELVLDVKSRWDLFTFTADRMDKIAKNEYWQMQGYMMLAKAQEAKLVSTLVNTPETIIADETKRMFWRSGIIDDSSPEFQAAADELRKQMIFDDIPVAERIFIRDVDRNDDDINRIKTRVVECREWLQKTFGQ